jgi:hypothetical protein
LDHSTSSKALNLQWLLLAEQYFFPVGMNMLDQGWRSLGLGKLFKQSLGVGQMKV